MSAVTYFAGTAGPLRWAMRGPSVLGDPAAYGAYRDRVLPARLTAVARDLGAAAAAGYFGTRFAAEFTTGGASTPGGIGVSISNTDPLFGFVDEPTRPHVIAARSAPYLHFRFPDGAWVRVRTVDHPGTTGRGVLARALGAAAPAFATALDTTVEEASAS